MHKQVGRQRGRSERLKSLPYLPLPFFFIFGLVVYMHYHEIYLYVYHDTCVLRLTRVRARPHVRLSLSHVCNMSDVATCPIFWLLKSASTVLRACCQRPLAALARVGAILLVSIRDVVVHSGYVPVRTLLGTCCGDLYWPIRRSQCAWSNQVFFEDLMHVWSLASCRNEYDEASS